MEFGLSQEQALLRESARSFLATECPATVVRTAERDRDGFDARLWSEAAHLGWLGCGIDETFGGYGDFFDAVVIAEEMGRSLCPVPYVSTVIFAAHAIQAGQNEELKTTLLPAIVGGQAIIADAISDQRPSMSRLALSDGPGDTILRGSCHFVRDAMHANYLLCVAETKREPQAVLIPTDLTGITIEKEPNISGECLCSITFSNVALPAGSIIGDAPMTGASVLRAWTGRSAWLLGSAQRMLDLTIEYAKARKQFGAPIGSFQAIQHQCADMSIALTMARGLVEWATSGIAKGAVDSRAVMMAKMKMLDVYEAVVAGSHKVHGAIGLTREYDLSLYTRRALSSTLGAVTCNDDLGELVEELGL